MSTSAETAGNFTMVLNSTNVLTSPSNNTLDYSFIQGGFYADDQTYIGVSQVILPYSFYNIQAQQYNNASFNISLTTSVTTSPWYSAVPSPVSVQISLPNGFYYVSDINTYIGQFSIDNGFYKTNPATGVNTYYISITQNPTYYTNQIICSLIETVSDGVSTYPSNFPFSPATAYTPQVIISASPNTFGTIIGYLPGSYPSTATQATNYSTLGNTVPNLTPVNGVIIHCNLVNNNVSFPTDILDTMSITTGTTPTAFGSNIIYIPYFFKAAKIAKGRYSHITLYLTDQNNNPLFLQDTNMLISLIIRRGLIT